MAGNVVKFIPPEVYGDYSITYTYDHAGNVLKETETGVKVENVIKNYVCDMLNRMTSSTDGIGKSDEFTEPIA